MREVLAEDSSSETLLRVNFHVVTESSAFVLDAEESKNLRKLLDPEDEDNTILRNVC